MTIGRSTYYKRPDDAAATLRRQRETALRSAVENVVADWPCYGYRRVTHELRRRGIIVNHKKVSRIMREGALSPKRVRRFIVTTDSDHDLPVFADLTKGFVPTGPDQLWVADLTYIRLADEFACFSAILDAWSRKVVGYALGNTLETRLTLAALDAAIRSRKPAEGLIHHSDRGSQYAAKAYRERLELHGIRGSMSRRANPYDNAKAESFMKTANELQTVQLVAVAHGDNKRAIMHANAMWLDTFRDQVGVVLPSGHGRLPDVLRFATCLVPEDCFMRFACSADRLKACSERGDFMRGRSTP